jgi:hypothetical protein
VEVDRKGFWWRIAKCRGGGRGVVAGMVNDVEGRIGGN